MWNKLSQAAALVTGEVEEEKDDSRSVQVDDPEKLQHQELLIQQLKDLVRENEKRFQEKAKECDELATKFDKFKLQSKAKITQLTKQVKDQDKATKKEDCDFDDASSTDSSERSQRGKILLLKKQLDQAKQQLEKKEEEAKTVIGTYERKINDLELLLNEKNAMITSLTEANVSLPVKTADDSPNSESNVQEMYAQIVYKDSKIMDLNNQILELEKKIMDLQENIKEKNEVLQQRNRAVQLMAEDLNRKGQTTVIELDETRDQMKIMQQNFASIESDWKIQLEKYQQKIDDLENELKEMDLKIKCSETTVKNLETARYELSIKNAELQQKIVHVQESASKQCEQFNKEVQGEIEILMKDLELEKKRSAELQKTLDEFNTESQNKIMKARVEERKKAKKLERELFEAKKHNLDKPEEIQNLQQQVIELEEEKGSLQLKLIEIEDQINQTEKLKDDKISLEKCAVETLNKIELFEKQISELQSEKENWKTNFDHLKMDYNSVKERFDILSKEHFETQEAMTTLIEDKKRLENDYKELEQKNATLENMHSKILHNLQQIKDEKVTFELKNIELEEMRDKDEETKKKLFAKIEELEKLLEDQNRPFIQLEKAYSELKQEVEDLELNKNELQTINSDLKENLKDFEQKHKDLKNKNSDLEVMVGDLEKDNNELMNSCNLMSDRIESLTKKLKEKELELADETKKLFDKITELNENYQALQQDMIIKTDELELSQNEVKETREKLSWIFKLFTVSNAEELTLVKTNYEATALQNSEFHSALTENIDLTISKETQIKKLQSHVDSLVEEKAFQEMIISQLRNDISIKNDAIHNLNSVHDHLTYEKIVLKENLKDISEEMREKEENLRNIIDEQRQKLSEYQDEINSKNSKLNEELNTTIVELNNELISLREDLKEKKETAKNLTVEVRELSNQNKMMAQKLEELDNILNKKNISIQELELTVMNKITENESLSKTILQWENIVKSKDNDLASLNEKLLEVNNIISSKEACIAEADESIEKLKEENSHLNKHVRDKTKEIELMSIEFSNTNEEIKKLEKLNTDLLENLSLAQKKYEALQSQIIEKEVFHQKTVEERSSLQNKNSKLQCVVNKLKDDIEIASGSLEKYKQKCEELSAEVSSLTSDISKYKTVKCDVNDLISKHKLKLTNLTDENKLLRNNINSLQAAYSDELSKVSEKIMLSIQEAKAEIALIEKEKSELKEMCNSLQVSMENNNLQIESQEREIRLLREERDYLADLLSEHKNKIEQSENKIKTIENELSISRMESSGEKSEMELMLQNIMSENKKLTDNEIELSTKLSQITKDYKSVQKSNFQLESLVLEKDKMIKDLESIILTKEETFLNMQNTFSLEVERKDAIIEGLETKFEILEQCKLNYHSLLNSLQTSFQLEADISFIESDWLKDHSLENFKQLSEEVLGNSVQCLVKNQNLVKNLENSIKELKNENSLLKNSLISSKENIVDLISSINSNINLNDSKLNVIIGALSTKNSALSDMESKLSLFKTKWKTKGKTNDFQTELDLCKQERRQLEEKIILLEQKLKNSDNIIQESVNEKNNLESSFELIKHKLKTIEEKNAYLELILKDKESSIVNLENITKNLESEKKELSSNYKKACENLQNLSKEFVRQSGVKENSIFNLNSLEARFKNLKNDIHKLNNHFSTDISEDFDFSSIDSDFLEKEVMDMLSELCSILSTGKNYKKINEKLCSKIHKLESENEKLTADLKAISEEKTKSKTIEVTGDSFKEVNVVNPKEQEIESNLTQQSPSLLVSDKSVKSLEEQNKSLKNEVTEYKKKFAKVLSKLKSFKDEKEKLSEKLQEQQNSQFEFEESKAKYLEKINFLQEKVLLEEREKEKCMTKIQSLYEQSKDEINTLNSNLSQMKERYSNLEKEFFKIQHEFQEYKQTWEQTNVSYELQKEDNEQLKLKLINQKELLLSYNSQIDTLSLQMNEIMNENKHLKQEAQNLREHADMLISDNDSFQSCIEKLTASKNTLEKHIADLKEKYDSDIKGLKASHEEELKAIHSNDSQNRESMLYIEKLENECASLRTLCTDLQLRVETLQLECETHQKNQNLLEKEKTYLQHQLSEKSSELQKVKSDLNDTHKNFSMSSMNKKQSDSNENSQYDASQLLQENTQLKQQLNKLVEEVNFAKEMNNFLQQEYSSKESSYEERLSQFEKQLQHIQSLSNQPSEHDQSKLKHLENELYQAMNSLHNQGLRCEELSLEVSKLLEEKNVLNWKLQQYVQLNPNITLDQNNLSPSSHDLQLVKTESSSNLQIAALHERLVESERTCQELRKANDALDKALMSEKDQKRRIEQELDLAKEHITEDTRPSDEYHVLLGDVNEPEMLTETNFSISRNVRTHAHKFRRWFRGRRNYLSRIVKSKNYPHLMFLIYIFFIHVWLLSCVFS